MKQMNRFASSKRETDLQCGKWRICSKLIFSLELQFLRTPPQEKHWVLSKFPR